MLQNSQSTIGWLMLVGIVVSSGCRSTWPTPTSLFPSRSGRAAEMKFANAEPTPPIELTWYTSMEEAQAEASQTGKIILADFTGSDWCHWCVKLKEDVFETPEFQQWADENAVLLELDYPRQKRLPPALVAQNEALQQRYQIRSYPTVLMLDTNGEVLGRLGYKKRPDEWIAAAESQLPASLRSRIANRTTEPTGDYR